MFGNCAILSPLFLLYVSVVSCIDKFKEDLDFKLFLSGITIILFCGLVYVFSGASIISKSSNFAEKIVSSYKTGTAGEGPGAVGSILGLSLCWAFGVVGAKIINILLIFISVMMLTGTSPVRVFYTFLRFLKAVGKKISSGIYKFQKTEPSPKTQKNSNETVWNNSKENKPLNDSQSIPKTQNEKPADFQNKSKKDIQENTLPEKSDISNYSDESPHIGDIIEHISANQKNNIKAEKQEEKNYNALISSDYAYPEVDLLNKSILPKKSDIAYELENNGKILVDTLDSFNVQTKITEISRGPSVTRYELQPAPGVKISKITSLADDIALNLAASGVRIEAPIPGKSAVGVEIPNKIISVVNMRDLISSQEFMSSQSNLTVVLGKDIAGKVVIADLSKMPHLLIAGSTGSGKSVCINSFIISLLYKATPDEVKMLMIDPKVVELGIYNGIPHLLVPVVTDPKKAAGALGWAVGEMLMRYKKFAENNVRDLASYNHLAERKNPPLDKEGNPVQKMPQMVIVIDELSDLMMAAPNEIEDYICRLAQMARAAGMYLVIATQRPSVDVITGIIKANIPSRIALAVSSQIDSRTIIDMSGAEKLLGRGDMMFSSAGSPKPIRVQGCYVTDEEIEKVIEAVKENDPKINQYDDNVIEEIEKNALSDKSKNSKDQGQDSKNQDFMMEEAIKCVIEAGQASTSLLQRRLKLGYARAGRLIDEMEQIGIVGPHEGSKPRQVIITYQQYLERNMAKNE
ncbi:MAG: DNA translocase FtsK [Oscillospiraceae bacterium]|nr:DNA translocase FtsK [Oscillospiraceae bacterium]